jgi:hypothetical protein
LDDWKCHSLLIYSGESGMNSREDKNVRFI